MLLGYDTAGRRSTVTTSDSVGTTLTYDGTLVTSESTTGAWPLAHSLNRSFSHYGELASWSLDTGTADVVMHDKDGLLTSNGPLGVGRGTNGLVKNITVGSTTETYSYNVNGEVLGVTTGGVTGGYAVTYVRDTLGRITKKTEVIGGTTVVTELRLRHGGPALEGLRERQPDADVDLYLRRERQPRRRHVRWARPSHRARGHDVHIRPEWRAEDEDRRERNDDVHVRRARESSPRGASRRQARPSTT